MVFAKRYWQFLLIGYHIGFNSKTIAMTPRPTGYGFASEREDEIRVKYSDDDESIVVPWMSARTGTQVPEPGQDNFREYLLDGTVLCNLINGFYLPGTSCIPYVTSGTVRQAMKNVKESQNIEMFLTAAENMGMNRQDMFQTADIRDGINMGKVLSTLYTLGTVANAKGVSGPSIGIKFIEQIRNVDDEQRAGRRDIIDGQDGLKIYRRHDVTTVPMDS